MHEWIITLSTPVFFLLIGIEYVVGRMRGKDTYRTDDMINSIGLGMISQVLGVFQKALSIGIYAYAVDHLGVWHLSARDWWVWPVALLAYDFCYYWLHRMSHEVAIIWAAHVVHHQSEHYNLSTALRQTSTGVLFAWVFYLPLAIAGVPVEVFVVLALIDLLYQFWVHTEQVGRLGWFDYVFVSPMNHRVHHAVNDNYLDRNYGGILIVWDRLFGTFMAENEETPVYGTRSPLRSWDPLWANLEVYAALWLDCWRTKRWSDKFLIWFKPPGWRPTDVAERFPKSEFDVQRAPFQPWHPPAWRPYVLLQFVTLLNTTAHFLVASRFMSGIEAAAYAAWIALGLWSLGALLQHRSGARWIELTRQSATLAGIVYSQTWFGIAPLPLPALILCVLWLLGQIVWLSCVASANSDARKERDDKKADCTQSA